MKKILVTGANGQLGNELRVIASGYPSFEFEFTDVQECNISTAESVERYIAVSKPDYLINCAAYTAVDKAENEQDTAYLLNSEAPKFLATSTAKHGCKLVHVSTDYVFDGTSHVPYSEEMPIKPVSLYGLSKAMGEKHVMEHNDQSIIIRTAWLYSSFGGNFVKTMIRLGKERAELGVVFDQIGSPTYARDLADCILQIISKTDTNTCNWQPGIYHYSNEGVCSWYDFTQEIHAAAGISTCKVKPIETKDYPTPARRPHFSVFNKKKIKTTYGIDIPYWKKSLEACIKLL
jgi:dTDP-4-dehydrorhamnose reductase